jgi:hypothetical protein
MDMLESAPEGILAGTTKAEEVEDGVRWLSEE